jgi:hypothetical protein
MRRSFVVFSSVLLRVLFWRSFVFSALCGTQISRSTCNFTHTSEMASVFGSSGAFNVELKGGQTLRLFINWSTPDNCPQYSKTNFQKRLLASVGRNHVGVIITRSLLSSITCLSITYTLASVKHYFFSCLIITRSLLSSITCLAYATKHSPFIFYCFPYVPYVPYVPCLTLFYQCVCEHTYSQMSPEGVCTLFRDNVRTCNKNTHSSIYVLFASLPQPVRVRAHLLADVARGCVHPSP